MKKRNVILTVASVALVAAIGIGATLAYFTDKDDVTNVVTMGHVSIDLYEYDSNDAITHDGLEFVNVLPGDELAKEPTILVTEDSQDAYIRATISVEGLDDEHAKALVAGLDISDEWFLGEDGYYYFKEEVEAKESIALFTTVAIPAEWGNEVADAEFTIKIAAEAIQADNFVPAKDVDGNVTGWYTASGAAVTVENYTQSTVETTETISEE